MNVFSLPEISVSTINFLGISNHKDDVRYSLKTGKYTVAFNYVRNCLVSIIRKRDVNYRNGRFPFELNVESY